MTTRILIVYSTSEGQTARIANRIAARLRHHGSIVDVRSAETRLVLEAYDAVIVGDPIHAVHHSRLVTRFLKANAAELNSKPSALFQVSLTSANSDAEHTATARHLAQELLDRTDFQPDSVALFAGALVYTKYGWLKRRIVRAIVKREGGDLDMSRDFEYTDWDAVNRFADEFSTIVEQPKVR